jgi:excisionase family DNA binding protein
VAEPSPDPWLDVRGAISRSLTSESTVLRAARSGKLQGYRINGNRVWRFRASAVDAWIESGTVEQIEHDHHLRLAGR